MGDGHLIGVMTAGEQSAQAVRWATAYGIDPADIHRIEIRYDRGVFARVYRWDVDEEGRRYCPHDHDHWDFTLTCELAEREPYDVSIISAAGVQAITDRMRALSEAIRNTHRALAPLIALLRAHHRAMRTDYRHRQLARRRRNR